MNKPSSNSLSSLRIALLLIPLVFAISCNSQVPEENSLSSQVDALFEYWDKPDSPGVSIAVVKDGEVVYSRGYGMANLEYDIPNSPSTIFHIASVSKQFTDFAVLLLAEEGKVSLEDDIRKYIPEVPDFGKTITLRHLATHTSGMRDQWNLLALGGWRLDDVITKEHIMKLVERQKALNFEPGAEYLYCNTGYTLLAEVVSRISGQSFAEFTKQRIFEPLGMTNTLFYDDHEKVVKNRAYSYYLDGNTYKKSVLNYANVGATSLFTTVEDLAKWAINFEQPQVGNPETMKQMHTRGILNNGDTIVYALGQGITEYKGLRRISHSGGDANFRTYLARFPDQGYSFIVFSNGANISPGLIGMSIADIYLKDLFTAEEQSNTNSSPEAPEEQQPMQGTLSDYTGSFYSDELATTYTFKVKDDQLVAEHIRHPDIAFQHNSGNSFTSNSWFFREAVFTRNARGQITGFLVNSGRVRNIEFTKTGR